MKKKKEGKHFDVMTVTMPREMHSEVKKVAFSLGMSKSEFIRECIVVRFWLKGILEIKGLSIGEGVNLNAQV